MKTLRSMPMTTPAVASGAPRVQRPLIWLSSGRRPGRGPATCDPGTQASRRESCPIQVRVILSGTAGFHRGHRAAAGNDQPAAITGVTRTSA